MSIDRCSTSLSGTQDRGAELALLQGAEKTFTELAEGLDKYAREVEEMYAPIWEREYAWAQRWMEVMDHPPEKVKARKRAYYARREKMLSMVPR